MTEPTPQPSNSADLAPTATDWQAEVTFTPWTDGHAVGFRCENAAGDVEYIYLNPSTDGGGDPDHKPNVFLYQGTIGDPAQDTTHHYYDLFTEDDK